MPLVLADRVNETTTTTSTGTITLAGAVSGYQSFAVIGNGNTTYYTIVHQTANEWEVGIGTYTSSGTTLSRDTVLASSNSGSLVNFSAGTKFVFCDYPAGRAVYLDTATNVTIPGLTLSSGNLAFTSTAQRITADMSNGTVSNRFAFQTSTTNGNTQVNAIPNGTSTTSQFIAYNNADPNNASSIQMAALSTATRLLSGQTGTGTYLPLTFFTNGSEQARIETSGNFGIGTASPVERLQVSGGGLKVTGASTVASGSGAGLYLNYVSGSNYGEVLALDQGVAWKTLRLNAADIQFYIANGEQMRLNTSGNLGIGTTSPTNTAGFARQLQIEGTTAALTLSGTTGTGKYTLGVPGANACGLWDNTASAYRWYVDSSGNLGIGTASPAYKLDVAGNINAGVTVGVNNSSSGASAISRFIAIGDAGNAVFGMTSSAYTDITGAADSMLLNASSASGGISFALDGVLRMKLDSSGNLGLGVTPSAWETASRKVFQIGTGGTGNVHFAGGATTTVLSSNYYFNGTNSIYINSGAAQAYVQASDGSHQWLTAASGTAGNAISFTQAMTLTAAGELLVGGTTALASAANRGNVTINGGSGGSSILALGTANSLRGYILHTGTNMQVFNGINATLAFGTNNTERMRLDSSGNLGIGTASPAQLVHARKDQAAYTWMRVDNQSSSASAYSGLMMGAFGNTWGLAVGSSAANSNALTFVLDAGGGNTEHMRLTTSGNLGLAAGNAPTQVLSIYRAGSTNAIMSAGNSNTGLNGTLFGVDTAGNGIINQTQALPLIFSTSNTERARITSGGKLLVGTATAGYGLFSEQRVTINPTNDGIVVAPLAESLSAYTVQANNNTGTRYAMYIANGSSTPVGTISFTSAATAYNTSSDRRLKDNIAPADDAGSVVDAIEVVKHDWKVGGHTRYGMIAQDLHMVAPEAVSVGDADDVEDFKNPWGVDYSKLVPMLVKEVQSLRKRVAELESK